MSLFWGLFSTGLSCWLAADRHVAALVAPTAEVISGQTDFTIPCTVAAAREPPATVRWMFNGTFVHPATSAGATVEKDGSLKFTEMRPEHTGKCLDDV